jgi:cobalt/nickel transport system permease protein
MDVTSIDYWATGQTSFLHRRAPGAKMVAWLLALAGVIISQNLFIILSIYLILLTVLLATRLPARRVAGLAAYPVIFALLFAVSQWQVAGPIWGLTIIAKATGAALATVLLIATTPYPQVFAVAQRYLPSTIGDGLFMAFRSVFIVMDKLQHLTRAVRIRGGLSGRRIVGNLRNVGVALGTLAIDSVDYSQRLYAIMRVRGYEGRIAAPVSSRPWTGAEAGVAVAGLLVFGLSLVWRVWYRILNPVSWFPLLAACIMLIFVEGARVWRR